MSHTPFNVALIANEPDRPVPDWVIRKFDSEGIGFVYQECYGRHDLEECAADAHVLWVSCSRQGLVIEENMDIFPDVGMVIKPGSGTDNVEHDACTKRGIIIAHTPNMVTDPTSDHTIAMLFTAARQIAAQDRRVRQGFWDRTSPAPAGNITGGTLGIVGFGRIGQAVAQKLVGFGMSISIYDPYVEPRVIDKAGVQQVGLEELLSQSQYVILSCPLNEDTNGLIGKQELSLMRSDAILVNAARAGVLDRDALIRAMKEEWIAAAALDVLWSFPLKLDDELLTLDNVVLTPHCAGVSPDHNDRVYHDCVDIIVDAHRNIRPRWIANEGVIPRWDLRRSFDPDQAEESVRETAEMLPSRKRSSDF